MFFIIIFSLTNFNIVFAGSPKELSKMKKVEDTSFSVPIVSGVVIMETVDLTLSPKDVINRLAKNAIDKGPLGISFFTFQALSYVIDVYRGDVPVQTKITDLALYIIAFPQLIAGPIVKYNTVNEQIQYRSHTFKKFLSGIKRFLLGLGKKMLLANSLAPLANASFEAAENLTFVSSWVGLIAYNFQIYYDFSGYSDMAIGLGKMFGFEYEENFDYPYISKSATEFWRRWHISLGTWFRDYVYIPLGGSRGSKMKNIRNLFVVWFLTGMWHGASWNYIIWGLYFGVLLFIERKTKDLRKKIPSYINMLITFILILISWTFFRIENFSLYYFKSLFNIGNTALIDVESRINLHDNIILLIVSFILATSLLKNLVNRLYEKLNNITIDLIDTTFYINNVDNLFSKFHIQPIYIF